MLRWPNNQGVMGDDPPYLVVGTEVSAKYKGAFCEAKVRKVVRSVKCKVNFKVGGSAIVTDDQIRGTLRVSATVEAKHPDRKEFIEACITKIQDCSQYTVVFDDGDITTLRRTALCLKSGRHFAESETLDQLPLTHPEHFGNPVVGNRRGGRRSRNPMSDESSEEEEEPLKGKPKEEKEADIGKVVCVELGDKKKQKDNWFPGLVVHPAAQEVVRIRVKDEYLVRSFKDGRYFTVPKKEASEFTREIGSKVDNNSLKTAVDKALQYLDKDELPPHWDRELLFRLEDASTASDSDAAFESESSDDEPREEKDHFVAQLYKFMDDRGTPINRGPAISGRDIDLYKLFKVVHKLGGYNRVTNLNQWKIVSHKLGFAQFSNTANLVKVAYKKYLHSFEDFYRKLGCTMVNHPRGNRVRHRGGRNLIRDKDRATPVNVPQSESKDKGSDTVDDDDDNLDKEEESAEQSMDEKDDDILKRKEVKEPESGAKLLPGPPSLERKLSDPQLLRAITPRGKPKRLAEGASSKCGAELKKKLTKVKGARAVDDEEEEIDMLDVEELEEEDDDKLATTRSKTKDDFSKTKSDVKINVDIEKKPRMIEGSEKRIKPSLTATVEKKTGRPSLIASSDKKGKAGQDGERKTVRSLAADFEKKARSNDSDKKDASFLDNDKKSRSFSVSENEKKIRPSLTATLERKKSVLDSEKKNRQVGPDTEKKIRPSLSADLERKKVRPSLTADPTKKVSRIDSERKKEKTLRPLDIDKEDTDRKPKFHDSDRKNSSESSRFSSAGDSDRKSSKSDSGDSDKRVNHKSKRGDDEKKKQQIRKKKDIDDNNTVDDTLNLLPSYKNVCVGDKLKVYYGPTHESKVTYEAKVLEVDAEGSEETYLVHYTGWNTRYDEWIKRSRIADNLSWSPARAKRRHQAQLPGVKKSSTKKRTLTPARDGTSPLQKDHCQSISSLPGVEKSRESQPARSSTPSSVTSSSSRTKSPAMRPGSARVTRNTVGDITMQLVEQSIRRTRTRRVSGQTDLVSESDTDSSESESEAEPSITRKSSRRLVVDKDDESSRKESLSRKKPKKREVELEVEDDEVKDPDKGDLKNEIKDEDDVSSETPSEEKVLVKKNRKSTKSGLESKTDIKVEPENESSLPCQSSKGRDFDLNQIRSELKGIDKTVKGSCPSESDAEGKTESDGEAEPAIDVDTAALLEQKASTLVEPDETIMEMEDVYEFKEPEPFEFEVRTKREPSVEHTNKLPKRPHPRIFDDVEPLTKKKIPRSRMGDSESSEEGSPSKKRFRHPIGKKDDLDAKIEAKPPSPDLSTEKPPLIEQVTPQKKTFSSSEDAFDKLRQSPSYRYSSGSPIRAPTPTTSNPSAVPVPMQSPPVLSCPPSSVITSSSAISISRPVASSASNLHAPLTGTKAVPVIHSKQSLCVSPPKINSTSSSLKPLPLTENKPSGIKPVLSSQSAPAPLLSSRPPILAAAVKVSSEAGVITRSDEWMKSGRHQIVEKSESIEDGKTFSAKPDNDDCIPPLVATALSAPLPNRNSPEPPQLLPMSGPAPKLFQEPVKADIKDVPMPQIKKESVVEIETVCSNSPLVIQLPVARPKTPSTEDQNDDIIEDDSPRKGGRRKTQVKRKKAVSKEFVEDSDTDSSDEERRLVIDKSESSDSSSETLDVKPSLLGKETDSKWRPVAKQMDSSFEQQKNIIVKKDDTSTPKLKDQTSSSSVDAVEEQTLSVMKSEETEEPEADNNLCSLLCEETIPGSPAPPSDPAVDVHTESNPSRTSDRPLESNKISCKVLEMPFASVPGNARSSGPSTSVSGVNVQFPKASVPGDKSDHPVVDLVAPKAGPSAVANEAAPVMDNTPPTTPDSSISTISNSPQGEHGDSISILDNESMKSRRDSEDAENKDFSDDDLDVGSRMKKMSEKKESECDKNRGDTDSITASPSSKKRRRSRKVSESDERTKRPRHSTARVVGQNAGSDSDDNAENTGGVLQASQNQTLSPNQSSNLPLSSVSIPSQTQASRSPRPSKYNFFVELAPELDASQRIALLQQTLQDLRKTYANVKQQLACIDRRRKKLRRREREARLEARKIMREERRLAREEVVSCS